MHACRAAAQNAKKSIASQITLHAFHVDCSQVKTTIIGNAHAMATLLLRSLAMDLRELCENINNTFGDYHSLISSWPRTVESFDEQLAALDRYELACGELSLLLKRLDLCVHGLELRCYLLEIQTFEWCGNVGGGL